MDTYAHIFDSFTNQLMTGKKTEIIRTESEEVRDIYVWQKEKELNDRGLVKYKDYFTLHSDRDGYRKIHVII